MTAVKRVGGVLGTLISVVLVAAVILSVGLLIAQRRSPGGIPEVAGYAPISLLSGSMSPVLKTGDMIVDRTVTPAQANNLKVGQIVTYKVPGRTFHGQPFMITHRIVGVFSITNKATGVVHRSYRTKGDANNAVDPGLVSPSQIIGVYHWRVPFGGYVTAFIHTRMGFVVFVVLPIVYLVGGEFLRRWRLLDEEERRERAALAAAADAHEGSNAG